MSKVYAFIYLYLLQFLSSMTYNFLSTENCKFLPHWLNLFLVFFFFNAFVNESVCHFWN